MMITQTVRELPRNTHTHTHTLTHTHTHPDTQTGTEFENMPPSLRYKLLSLVTNKDATNWGVT